MSLLALILIIISALMHATWNYLSKRSEGGLVFVWLYMAVSSVIYIPLALIYIIFQDIHIGWIELVIIIASSSVHLAYSLTLQKGYKVGDLSLIYPVARGAGPMIATLGAIYIYNEQPSIFEFIGILFIVISVFAFTGGFTAMKNSDLKPFGYGILIGAMIAGYTLLDKGAVSVLLISPLLLSYGNVLGQVILLTPFVWKRRGEIAYEWKSKRKEIIGVGILNPLAYLLILITMVFTPLSHVATVREISILIGTIMGTKLLAEGFGMRRLAAAFVMVIGVIIVALN